jgi:hypothetical protein
LAHQVFAKPERLVVRARLAERARIGRDADERAQREGRQPERDIVRYGAVKPSAGLGMVFEVISEGIDEDVDVGQVH